MTPPHMAQIWDGPITAAGSTPEEQRVDDASAPRLVHPIRWAAASRVERLPAVPTEERTFTPLVRRMLGSVVVGHVLPTLGARHDVATLERICLGAWPTAHRAHAADPVLIRAGSDERLRAEPSVISAEPLLGDRALVAWPAAMASTSGLRTHAASRGWGPAVRTRMARHHAVSGCRKAAGREIRRPCETCLCRHVSWAGKLHRWDSFVNDLTLPPR